MKRIKKIMKWLAEEVEIRRWVFGILILASICALVFIAYGTYWTEVDKQTVLAELAEKKQELLGCQAENTSLLKEVENGQKEILRFKESLEKNEASYRESIEFLKTQYKDQYATLEVQFREQKQMNSSLRKEYLIAKQNARRDISYSELKSWLAGTLVFGVISDNGSPFNCLDWAAAWDDAAEEYGIRAGVVFLVYHWSGNTQYGHTIVCFETTDKGLVFIEPQTKQEVPIEIGKQYLYGGENEIIRKLIYFW